MCDQTGPQAGMCRKCAGTGGEIREVQAVRTEMKKVKGPDGEDKMVPEVLQVNLPQKFPCDACGGLPAQISVSASVRSASPFHSGIQSTRARGGQIADKDSWKGDGLCKYCKGTGYAKKGMSPTRRLMFEDES